MYKHASPGYVKDGKKEYFAKWAKIETELKEILTQLEAEAYERGREDAFGEATRILLSTIKRDTPTT